MANILLPRRIFFAICVLLLVTAAACKDKKKETTTSLKLVDIKQVPDSSPPPPPPPPAGSDKMETIEKCYINRGLKYETTVKIKIAEVDATGTVSSQEIGTDNITTTPFTATLNKDGINVTFRGTPPPVGDASEWTSKPWNIHPSGKTEVLEIIFNAKDYNTNQWKDTKFAFEPCK